MEESVGWLDLGFLGLQAEIVKSCLDGFSHDAHSLEHPVFIYPFEISWTICSQEIHIIMEVKNHPKWNLVVLEIRPFSTEPWPWLWEDPGSFRFGNLSISNFIRRFLPCKISSAIFFPLKAWWFFFHGAGGPAMATCVRHGYAGMLQYLGRDWWLVICWALRGYEILTNSF